jgi:hypothetical protein
MKAHSSIWHEFDIPSVIAGRHGRSGGRYNISDGVVTVRSDWGEEATQQGGLPAVHVAEVLLRSIMRNAGAGMQVGEMAGVTEGPR